MRCQLCTVTAIVLAALLAACGSGSPTPPPATPTATPAATPEPTPDPVALAIEQFAAKGLRARAALDGSVEAQGTTFTATGTMDVIGDAEHETYETKVGDQVIETKEVLSIGTEEWEMVGAGPWHDADGADDTALVTDLAELTSLTVVGEETLDGKPVIHVQPGPGVTLDPRGWGPSDPAVTDWTSKGLDLWIAPDGTLVKMEQTSEWQQPSGAELIPVTQHTIATFSPLAASATITAPADAWVAYTSPGQGYTMSQPDGYVVDTGDGSDVFMYEDAPSITVTSTEPDATIGSIDDYVQALAASYKESMGAELMLSVQPPAGHTDARIAVFKVLDEQGTELRLVDAMMLEGGRLWEVFRVGLPDTVTEDIEHVGDSLTTFEVGS